MSCFPPLYRLLFVLAAIDNIDFNSSSTTAMTNLHGTAFSLLQCLCRNYAGRIEGPHPDMNSAEHTDSQDLPEYYASIEPVSNSAMKKADILLLEGERRDDKSVLYEELQMESQWLADTAAACSAAYHPTTKDSGISWAAFHANRQEGIPETMKTAILPLFTESSNSPAMIKHAMSVTNVVVKHLYPGKIPVIDH